MIKKLKYLFIYHLQIKRKEQFPRQQRQHFHCYFLQYDAKYCMDFGQFHDVDYYFFTKKKKEKEKEKEINK